jgi:hypothetical protein
MWWRQVMRAIHKVFARRSFLTYWAAIYKATLSRTHLYA